MDRRQYVWQIARFSGAATLFAAGLVKLLVGSQSFNLGPLTLSSTATGVVAAGEVALAAWLMSGKSAEWARWTSIAVFSMFGLLSAILAWRGLSTCGCLGVFTVPPIVMCSIDFALLALIVGASPPTSKSSIQTIWYRGVVRVASVEICLLLGVVSLPKLLFYLTLLSGKYVNVEAEVVNYGNMSAGEIGTKKIVFVNNSSTSVRLIGGSWDCSCRVNDMPQSISPGERLGVSVSVRIPPDATTGQFIRDAEVWTDTPGQPVLRLPIVCSVRQ